MDLALTKVLDVSLSLPQWIGSEEGTDDTRTITLDVSTFTTAATYYPQGRLLAGLPLGKITSGGSSGKYGLYASGASDGRQVAVGFLYKSVWVNYTGGHLYGTVNTAIPVSGALMWNGVVITSALTTIYGATFPAGAVTDLAAKFRFE